MQNGESTGEDGMPEFRRESKNRKVFTAIDQASAVDGHQVTEFLRTYEGMKGHRHTLEIMESDGGWGGPSSRFEIDSAIESPLEGQAVRFKGSDAGWEKSPAEGSSLGSDALSELDADLTHRFLLPEKDAKRGSKWSVDASFMKQLISPGGDLQFELVEEQEDVMHSTMTARIPMDSKETEWSGSIEIVHKGRKKVRGSRLLQFEMKVDTTGTNHATFEMPSGMEDEIPPGASMGPSDIATDYEFHYKGKGLIDWDPDLGQIVALELNLEVEETASERTSMEMPGMGKLELETSELSRGSFRLELEAGAL